MKTFIILLALSSTAYAEPWQETCKAYQELAKTIMNNRQEGIDLNAMIEQAKGNKPFEKLIIKAYRMPRFSTEKFKQQSINDYGNSVYLMCADTLGVR